MTKSLTYVEIDVPDTRTVSHLSFDVTSAEIVAGSAKLVDDNPAGTDRDWSAVGTVNLTTNHAFGDAMLAVSGSGAVTTPDTPDLALGSGDFSIEFYFLKNTATGTERNFCGQRAGVGGANTTRSFNIETNATGVVRAMVYQGSTEIACAGTTVFGITPLFHHVSFNRFGNVLSLYVDGVLEGTNTISGAVNDSTGLLAIGQDGEDTSGRFNGNIDEWTYSKYARRTANFTPADPNVGAPGLQLPARTIRFAVDTGYLPFDIDAIPSLIEVKIDPAIISLGVDIGQRATVTARFRDHRHIFESDAFDTGTFWGKFRARYGLRLRGYNLRVISGSLGQALGNMETRNFVIESTDGPSPKGEFQIIAKDVLKFADGDRAQAPVLSNGFLSANITSVASSLTLAPAGIGDAEYDTAGFVAIGGSEICSFTRSGDVMTLVRGQFNTDEQSHNAQDRVQACFEADADNPADILYSLLVDFANVPAQYINLPNWQAEITTYLSTLYSALVAEPTDVSTLISELIEQVGLVLWWDEIGKQIKLQVLHPIGSTADVYSGDNYMAGSLEVVEQPEKRLTQVYTYFAKINPLVKEDQTDNYRSTAFTIDNEAEIAYGSAAIKKIFSRWIPAGGRAVASTLNDVLLARFRDPPRRISFNVMRGSGSAPLLGVGYQVEGWPFQARDGSPVMVPAQITRLNPRADYFEVEVEELSGVAVASGSPGVHVIIIDGNISNVNLRSMHDSIYGTPVSGNEVRVTVNAGVIVGATNTAVPAVDVGTWPSGVIITLTVSGRIQGCGGAGGAGSGSISLPGAQGAVGGPALFTRKAITMISSAGAIWGGGGGGGGGGEVGNVSGQPLNGGAGGGGGAGTNAGAGAAGGAGLAVGASGAGGSPTAGGAGGGIGPSGGGAGGSGAGPGLTGATGQNGSAPIHTNGNVGGSPGAAIDGVSFVTTSGGAGDRRGPQIN